MRSCPSAWIGVAMLACHTPAPPSARGPGDEPAVPAAAVAGEPIPVGRLPDDVRVKHQSLDLAIDPASARFGGTTEIALQLTRPRDTIWLHGRGLEVSSTTVSAAGVTLTARWHEVDPSGVVRISLPSRLAGDVALRVAFTAAYDPQLVGVYRVETTAGPAVYSKLEAIYARRAFPCFDEPAFKLPYDVALTVPTGDVAIGNMPIVEVIPAGAGHKRIRFQTTPPLPSYLVAFAVGPFETRASSVPASKLRRHELPITAVTLRGRGDAASYALSEARALIAEQERYFGIGFPFPKLDLIAVPDFQSGAMENAGAITFRDSSLLVDDSITSLGQRIGVTRIIAHETAHQWYGDLVTMPWWNELWLNEGFATFLATKTLRAVRPAFEAELAAADSANTVMASDGLASARRIRQPIETSHDITNAFDGITYQKGAAVLAMLEQFVGEEPFRAGLRELLTAHAWGNATTDDVVAALARSSGQELGPLVSSFLDQPGVPVISARLRCTAGKGRIELAQSRWRAAGAPATPGRWIVPVCVRTGTGGTVDQACTVLSAPTGWIDLPSCPAWFMANASATGYYRSVLPPDDLDRLRFAGFAQLSEAERLRFAHDLEAAYRSAQLPGRDVLRALEPVARHPHGAVAAVPLALYAHLDDFVVDGAERKALRGHVGRLYAPAVAALGWQPAGNERPSRRLFRTKLFEFLALTLEDPAILGEAARLGRQLLGLGGGAGPRGAPVSLVSPDLAGLALQAAARTGGGDVFDALVGELARAEDAQVRQRVLIAIGTTREPVLVGRALALGLDPRLRKNERLIVLGKLLGDVATRDAAWAWLRDHFDALAAVLPDRFAGQIPGLFHLCDPRRADELRGFFVPRMDSFTGGPRKLAQALETALQCAARADAQRASVHAYLRELPRL